MKQRAEYFLLLLVAALLVLPVGCIHYGPVLSGDDPSAPPPPEAPKAPEPEAAPEPPPVPEAEVPEPVEAKPAPPAPPATTG